MTIHCMLWRLQSHPTQMRFTPQYILNKKLNWVYAFHIAESSRKRVERMHRDFNDFLPVGVFMSEVDNWKFCNTLKWQSWLKEHLLYRVSPIDPQVWNLPTDMLKAWIWIIWKLLKLFMSRKVPLLNGQHSFRGWTDRTWTKTIQWWLIMSLHSKLKVILTSYFQKICLGKLLTWP